MFGMGISEIIVIVAIAVIVLGPKDFIIYAKKIARALKKVVRFREDVESAIKGSIDK
jgi:Sec-independent protein translocase protein TatA